MRGGRRAGSSREAQRARRKRQAQEFYQRSAIWTCRRMAIAPEEREWRIMLITGPDDRSLTGKICGDPVYLRSMLYAKRMGFG